MIMVGASAYPRVIDFARIARVSKDVGAPMVVDMAHIAGLVAAGVHPSPVPHAEFVTSTTHKTLRGPRAGLILCREQYAKDLDRAMFPGVQGGPLMHIIAAKAVCLKEAMEPAFGEYQRQIVANDARRGSSPGSHAVWWKETRDPAFGEYQRQIVANAARLASSLGSHGFRLVSGGTDNHLMLV